MKGTTSFLVSVLILLSTSTAQAFLPAENFTDRNGDKRHVKTGKVYQRHTSSKNCRKDAQPNGVKISEVVQKRPLKEDGAVKLSDIE